MFRFRNPSALRLLVVGLSTALVPLAFGGCGDDHGHANASRVELETRGAIPTLLAIWTEDDGWQNPAGEAISELPNPIVVDGSDDLLPLTAGGPNASLSLRFYDLSGEQIPMSTLDRDDTTRERTCSEYWGRYQPDDNDTSVIAWPAIPHPDSPEQRPSSQFVELSDGNLAGIFHCDHIHLYPKQEGTVDLRFLLWHVDHSDGATTPLTLRVHPQAEEPSEPSGENGSGEAE